MKKKWFPLPTISFVQIQATKFFKNDVWSVEIVSDVNVIIFATQKYFLLFGFDESFEIITRKMISNALGNSYFLRKENYFHLEMSFCKWFTSKKNDFEPVLTEKKMITTCEKWFT